MKFKERSGKREKVQDEKTIAYLRSMHEENNSDIIY
jgi:hypothetical protein